MEEEGVLLRASLTPPKHGGCDEEDEDDEEEEEEHDDDDDDESYYEGCDHPHTIGALLRASSTPTKDYFFHRSCS